ncbi:ribonuclease J [Candidatus Shapirobacteria bacterium]|nr:ribonuclease J [Candidatus Shapirobacteria bacterium]
MNKLRIVALGDFASVTSNLFAYHFLPDGKENNDQILLVDCGLGFVQDDTPETKLVGPDVDYLVKRKNKIAGLVLTHGHEDHIGALPEVLIQLGVNFPIWASKLTAAMAQIKLDEARISQKIKILAPGQSLSLGGFKLYPIGVTHSLPGTFHFLIETPIGSFYHGTDFKFDLNPPDGIFSELGEIARLSRKPVLALLSDCLGAEKKGYSPSETILNEMFDQEIKKAKGRVFITAISSNFYRWQQALKASAEYGRKVALIGYSIRKNVKIASEQGYVQLNRKQLVDDRKIKNIPDNKLTLLIAGGMAQVGSSLAKVAAGKHKIKVKKTDKFIFSSPDYIPGTSAAINNLINNLVEQGAEVVYEDLGEELHVSGHGSRQELALLINLVSAKYLLPIGGEWRHRRQYGLLASQMGYLPNQILLPKAGAFPTFWENGQVDFNFQLGLNPKPLNR